MPKLAVMLGIEPVQNARAYSTLPLHCTLLQWVVVDEAEKYTLLGNLRRIITTIGNSMSFSTIDLFATHEEMFGVNADVPVHVIEPSMELLSLHRLILDCARAHNAHPERPEWAGAGYRPHVTTTRGLNIVLQGRTYASQIYAIEHVPGLGKTDKIVRWKLELPA